MHRIHGYILEVENSLLTIFKKNNSWLGKIKIKIVAMNKRTKIIHDYKKKNLTYILKHTLI